MYRGRVAPCLTSKYAIVNRISVSTDERSARIPGKPDQG